jgi:urea transport system permease protein
MLKIIIKLSTVFSLFLPFAAEAINRVDVLNNESLDLIAVTNTASNSSRQYKDSTKPTIKVNPSEQFNNLFEKTVKQLPGSNFKTLPSILTALSEFEDPRSEVLLNYLSEGNVYFHPSTKKVIYFVKNASGERAHIDAISNEATDAPDVRLKKVKINNSIRSFISQLQAQQNLNHQDTTKRLESARELLSEVDSISADVLTNRIDKEQDDDVIELLKIIFNLKRLKHGDAEDISEALDFIAGSLEPDVKAALMIASVQTDKYSKASIQKIKYALAEIDTKRQWYAYIEIIFFGLSLGSVLLLAAIGLTITFGVMGVINMAHGEMIMLGAYTTYVIQQVFPELINYSLFIAIPAAFIVSGTVGIIVERSIIQFLKSRPLETLLATFGVSLILQQLVRTVFSPLNRQVASPDWMSGSLQINPAFSVTFNRLYIILFSLFIFFALLLFLKKSSLGLHMRAVAQNREMARALSIKSNWVDAATFGLGSGIAGIAGVVLSQLTNVGPNLGQAYIIDSFLVVVFGGIGNLWGTLVSAMTLGILNKFLEPITGPVLATIIVLVGLVFFIQKRPKGLFPQKGRSE